MVQSSPHQWTTKLVWTTGAWLGMFGDAHHLWHHWQHDGWCWTAAPPFSSQLTQRHTQGLGAGVVPHTLEICFSSLLMWWVESRSMGWVVSWSSFSVLLSCPLTLMTPGVSPALEPRTTIYCWMEEACLTGLTADNLWKIVNLGISYEDYFSISLDERLDWSQQEP